MSLLGKFGESRMSIFKDPFNKENIISFSMEMDTHLFKKDKYFYGRVRFKNGNTEGTQRTKTYDNFDDLYMEMKQIFESLK